MNSRARSWSLPTIATSDRAVDRIVELEEGALTEYAGSYADYVEQKAARRQKLAELAARQQRQNAAHKRRA